MNRELRIHSACTAMVARALKGKSERILVLCPNFNVYRKYIEQLWAISDQQPALKDVMLFYKSQMKVSVMDTTIHFNIPSLRPDSIYGLSHTCLLVDEYAELPERFEGRWEKLEWDA